MADSITTEPEQPFTPVRTHPLWANIWVVLGIALIWRMFTFETPDWMGYDEATYQRYAQTLSEQGFSGIRELIGIWPQDEVLNKGPLPFRLFFIGCVALANQLYGEVSLVAQAALSALFGLGIVVVSFLLARRWCGPVVATATALLVAFSPLMTALSRRGLQDTCFSFIVLLTLWCLDRAVRHNKTLDFGLLFVTLTAGFLTKESMVFFYPVFFMMVLIGAKLTLRTATKTAIVFLLAPLVHTVVVAIVSGGFSTMMATYRAYWDMQGQIPYALQYQQGPWFRYLIDFMLVAPIPLILALIGSASIPPDPRLRSGQLVAAMFLVVGLLVFSLAPILNIRFVLALDFPLRLAATLGIATLAHTAARHKTLQTAIMVVLFAAVLAHDIRQFHTLFETGGIYDPVTAELIRANGLVR